eukprot:scaffold27521_cov30-Tisochrysis_lutea.AAC.13
MTKPSDLSSSGCVMCCAHTGRGVMRTMCFAAICDALTAHLTAIASCSERCETKRNSEEIETRAGRPKSAAASLLRRQLLSAMTSSTVSPCRRISHVG